MLRSRDWQSVGPQQCDTSAQAARCRHPSSGCFARPAFNGVVSGDAWHEQRVDALDAALLRTQDTSELREYIGSENTPTYRQAPSS